MEDWERAAKALENVGMQEALDSTTVIEESLMQGFDDGLAEGIALGKADARAYILQELSTIREFVAKMQPPSSLP
jgi:hypothetical protein